MGIGIGLGLGLGGGSGGGDPRAQTVTALVPLQTGLLTTVSTFGLLAPVAFAKTGGNANLTIGAATGGVSAAVALTTGASQALSGTATGADGCVIPFGLTVTGAASALSLALSSALVQGEGNSGTVAFVWTLTLNRDGSTAAFPYTWGTAGNGGSPADAADFGGTFPSGSGTFAPGETVKTITVLVTGDTAVEPAETFLLTVAAAGLNTVTSIGTISNDDATGATYLPTSTSPLAVFGVRRGISGYSGNLVHLRRASDNATQAFAAASGSDYPDWAAISTWTGGADPFVTGLYDQMTGTLGPVQATPNTQPLIDLSNPTRGAVSGNDGSRPTLNLAGSYPRRNISMFGLMGLSISKGAPFSLNNGTTSNYEAMAASTFCNLVSGSSAGGSTAISAADTTTMRTGMNAIGFVGSTSNRLLFVNDKMATKAANTIDANAENLRLMSDLGGGLLKGSMTLFALYPALSQTDAQAVQSALVTIGSVRIAGFDRRVVVPGDSIAAGQGGSNRANNVPWRLNALLTGTPEVLGVGIASTLLQTWDTNFATGSSAFNVDALYTSAYSKAPVMFIQAGTNDIFASNATGATLYGYANSLINKAKAKGFKVVICTLLPATRNSGAQETERQNYNALVVANSAGADAICDYAAQANMGPLSAASNTALYPDGIHPSDLGYSHLAPVAAAAVNGLS